MAPYGEDQQVGHFGVDDPATAVVERMPFVVDYREDVDLSPLGRGGRRRLRQHRHRQRLARHARRRHHRRQRALRRRHAGSRARAPRSCRRAPARSPAAARATGLAEGMIDLVLEHDVDVVNVSIGGLPALNDGSDAIAVLYDEIVEQTGTQIFVSAGNNGPGVNTVGSPSVAEERRQRRRVGQQGHLVGRLRRPRQGRPGHLRLLLPWPVGERRPEADPRRARCGGVDHASLARGIGRARDRLRAAARLLDVQRHLDGVPPGHRSRRAAAVRRRADRCRRLGAGAALGADQHRRPDRAVCPRPPRAPASSTPKAAWKLLERGVAPRTYDVSAPVCSPLSHQLTTPHRGTGVYNRCLPADGGQSPGTTRTYSVKVTPRDGGSRAREHRLSWIGNGDRTFSAPAKVSLRRGVAGTIRITARPDEAGEHSAILRVDDPATQGVDRLVPVTVVATAVPSRPAARDADARLGPARRHRVGLRRGARRRPEPGARAHRRRRRRPGQVPRHRPVRRAGRRAGEQPLLHQLLGRRRAATRPRVRTTSRLPASGSSRSRRGVRRPRWTTPTG